MAASCIGASKSVESSDKPRATLEQWRTIRVAEGDTHLVGIVSGHRHLRDGGRIVTSAVLTIVNGQAETQKTLYTLGAAGMGPLPPDWAEKVDQLLVWRWKTCRIDTGPR